jgi:hypothetical protein
MTVFYAFRLNTNLRHFRQGRAEMESLVNKLTANIERAEKAVEGLQVSARNSGIELDKKIKESKFLADELKFMGEAGNNLATRLEKLADRNRELLNGMEQFGGIGPASPSAPHKIIGAIQGAVEAKPFHGARAAPSVPRDFIIQDREFEEDQDDDLVFEKELEIVSSQNFQSESEREFFEALQNGKRGMSRN